MGMAPRRRGNHLVHVPVAALGKPVDGSDGRWAQSKPITVSASEAIANADVKIQEVTTERRMLEGMILAQPKPMIASGMPTATTAATFADATRVQLGGDLLSGTAALADGAAAPAGRRAKHGRRARAASAELAGATTRASSRSRRPSRWRCGRRRARRGCTASAAAGALGPAGGARRGRRRGGAAVDGRRLGRDDRHDLPRVR